MPFLARFYGIVIRMYFLQSEHNPPHIHAIYDNHAAAISIVTGDILDGWIPNRAMKLVSEWLEIHKMELLDIWETQEFRRLPPLD